jgi:chromosome transmission fidelity protein 18
MVCLVLLLCGPPGLGKTTLAHVAAKHCGYRVVEINASDDRVATTLQAKILDAIQMKSVTGDKRPNCLVIDEIDGIMGGTEGKGAVDALVEMINAEKNLPQQKENEAEDGFIRKGSKKKGHTAVHRLSRPVICICNDLYAPALRALRQVARYGRYK